jgi:hypothetical protein
MNKALNKEQIISLAESIGFKLDYDKWDNPDTNEFSNGKWLRFISQDESLDERELRWIWYKEDSDEDNYKRGQYIKSRLDKKRSIKDFLKY